MADEQNDLRPPWWQVQSRHAAREARQEARERRRPAGPDAKRGPTHDPVTPEGIADAALRIIDMDGLEGLTVRALATELGLGTMTLYWYVKNKGEVLDLAADRMLAGLEMPPEEGDWRDRCRRSCIAIRAAFLAHPRAVPLMVGRGAFGPNSLRMVEYAIGAFRAAGFAERDAADAYFAAANYVTGFCTSETGGSDPINVSIARDDFAARARQYISLLPADKYPNLVSAAPRIFGGDRDDRFLFGVDCLIAGFEARLAARRTHPVEEVGDANG